MSNQSGTDRIREYKASEYDTPDNLFKAFVHDGITHGHVLNLIVYGNTLYLDEGNDGRNLYFYQLAIRLSDDVYVVNNREKHINNREKYRSYRDQIRDILTNHTRAKQIYMTLPTLNNKSESGIIKPTILKSAIKAAGVMDRTKAALKKYVQDHKQSEAIENYRLLLVYWDNLPDPDHPGFMDNVDKAIIKNITQELQHARKVCSGLDKYLDILTMLPERSL